VILAVSVCPHPPLLVPELAPGTNDELGGLRAACDASVAALVASGAGRVVVLGAGLDADHDKSAGGTLAAYGVDVRAGGDELGLPLAHTIGAWLLDRAGWDGPRTYSSAPRVDDDAALLVVADGTNTRSEKAPGFFDERAEAYDAAIVTALAAGDPQALMALDPDLGTELGSSGVPALRALGRLVQEQMRDATVVAKLRYDGAPLGVGYVVADWVL
jgi:HPt (histidine-containing phosphotransfer) domain-containing protein